MTFEGANNETLQDNSLASIFYYRLKTQHI